MPFFNIRKSCLSIVPVIVTYRKIGCVITAIRKAHKVGRVRHGGHNKLDYLTNDRPPHTADTITMYRLKLAPALI